MSYLTPPRLVFGGQFQADVSTVNNDPEHFDTARFQPQYWEAASGVDAGWWNPAGTGSFRLSHCKVASVTQTSGHYVTTAESDPAVGMVVGDTADRVPGRMVDLDPENQLVSQIWGWRVFLAGPTGEVALSGDFHPAAFSDMWLRVQGGSFDSGAAACWQSVLTDLAWGDLGDSSVLHDLKERADRDGRLSMKFNLDSVDDDPKSPTVTFGRIVGSIGTSHPTEPRTFIAGRRLDRAAGRDTMQSVPVEVHGDTAWLDLGNSMPTTAVGGEPADLGPLELTIGGRVPGTSIIEPTGGGYGATDWYEMTAGIVGVRLSAHELARAANEPLGIATPVGAVLGEADDGLWVRAETVVMRVDPGEKASTTMFARRFGRAAADLELAFGLDNTVLDQQRVVHQDLPGPMSVGDPPDAVSLPSSVRTSSDGTVEITISTSDPGNPRRYIDGQIYQATYGPGPTPPAVGAVTEPSRMLNLLVWTAVDASRRPTWTRDVGPIFRQYASLYPVMKPIVDLANYGEVVAKKDMVRFAFSADVSDPRYMPVTRDLSTGKRDLILRWLEDPIFFDPADPDDLRRALQVAIELEHATIPPYLCALFSIKRGTNRRIAGLLNSVVVEEMGHMMMAANLLVAIGGKPEIGTPGFVPRYPGPLPGGLASDLTVRLRRLSIEQIRDLFLVIERPSILRRTHDQRQTHTPGEFTEPHTIAALYAAIATSLNTLADEGSISFGHVDNQVVGTVGGRAIEAIVHKVSALEQLHTITAQGAGVGPDNPTVTDAPTDATRLGHYYRFTEIVEGRTLAREGDSWSYTGDVIPFDPEGIWPMVDDPALTRFEPGSRARVRAEAFSNSYQALLGALHDSFRGETTRFNDAIALMHSVSILGRQLASTQLDDGSGQTAGPVF